MFKVFADGTSNLPENQCKDVTLVPCHYSIDGEELIYDGNLSAFDAHEYYEGIAQGKEIKTSLINTYQFEESFTPVLKEGNDVIYVSMAGGISGTYQAAVLSAQDLMDQFPGRTVRIINSKTCGMGSGLQVIRAVELSKQNLDTNEAADILDEEVDHWCSYFTVDDIHFLEKTGRVSHAVATACALASLKPILYGSSEGNIEKNSIARGRKGSLKALADKYKEKAVNPSEHIVAISHGDCEEDAKALADMINEIAKPKELIIVPHEPFSGAHVGPGMMGLFFYGTER